MADTNIMFDLTIGRNDVSKALDQVKGSASTTQKALDQMNGTLSTSSKGVNELSNSSKKVENASMSFGKLSAAAFGVVGSVAAAYYSFKEFIGAAIEAEESVSRMEVALKQTGVYSEKTSKQFQDLASKIQETTIYTDDQVLSTAGLLQTIGQFTDDGLKKATEATIALASAMKIDLETAATLVGKAANGNIDALKRYGISVKKGKNDSETFANVLKELSRFSSSSSAELDTLGGSFKFLSNQISEAAESASKATVGFSNLKVVVKSIAETIRDFRTKSEAQSTKENIIDAMLTSTEALFPSLNAVVKLTEKLTGKNLGTVLKGAKDISKEVSKTSAPVVEASKTTSNASLLLQTEERRNALKAQYEKELDTELDDFIEKSSAAYEALARIAPKTQLQIIEEEKKNRLEAIDLAYSYEEISAKQLAELKQATEKDYFDKVTEYNKKLADQNKKIAEDEKKAKIDALQDPLQKAGLVVGGVLGGKEGLRTLLQGSAGIAGNIFGGPAGGALASQLTGFLTQGAEANREMIRQFAAAVPELITSIIESIPAIIDELVKQTPKVVEGITNSLSNPKLWEGVVRNLLSAAVNLATMQAKAFINYIPKFFKDFGENLIKAIVDGFKQAASGVGDAVGGFVESIPVIGSVYSGVKNLLGFAQGGMVKQVPNGFPNDSFPARLTSSELVIDRSTTQKLNDFLNSGSNDSATITDALLSKILDKLSEPMNVNTTANVNGKAFADIILQLNRNNARLTV